jgi:hypothetical protein
VKLLPSPNTHKKYFVAQTEIKPIHVAIQFLHTHKNKPLAKPTHDSMALEGQRDIMQSLDSIPKHSGYSNSCINDTHFQPKK